KKLGIARSTLANSIRLLDLPSEIQMSVAQGDVSEGQAKLLLSIDSEKEQMQMYRQILSGAATSVRALSSALKDKSGASKRRSIVDHELQDIEEELQSRLGTKVSVKKKASGGFQILIDAYSAEEFKSVVKKLRK
ncbi:MAG: chromosome partitioning protein ParB, partial [Candidatus Kerfeldbacteria bacterium]